MITCTRLRSTSSCVLLFASAGCPAVSAKKISTLRPANVLLRSLSSRLMPSLICRPPAASGPERTVRNPTRRFSVCAKAPSSSRDAAQASAADNNGRSRFMAPPKGSIVAIVRVAGILPASSLGCGSLVPDGRKTRVAGYNGRSAFSEGTPALRSDLLTLASSLAAREERFALVTVVRREPPSSARVGDTAVITAGGGDHGSEGGGSSRTSVLCASHPAVADGDA